MPSNRASNGQDDAVELIDATGRVPKRTGTRQSAPPEYSPPEDDPPEYSPRSSDLPGYSARDSERDSEPYSTRIRQAAAVGASARTPFIESDEDAQLREQETITVFRSVQFIARLVFGAFVLIVQCVVVGLAASAMSGFGPDYDDAEMAIGILAVAGFIEVAWLCFVPCLLCCCCYSPVLLMSLGFIGVEALATSLYTLVVVGSRMRISPCADQREAERCQDAVSRGLAAACVRILITVPICLGVSILACVLQRRVSSGRAPGGGFMGWSLLMLGNIQREQSP